MKHLLVITLGGGLGSGLRYLLSAWAHRNFSHALAGAGTLAVNLAGCFLIGFFALFFTDRAHLPQEYRIFLVTGILGGFTTFSAFGLESFYLLQQGQWGQGLLNIGLNLGLGLLLVAMGFGLANWLIR